MNSPHSSSGRDPSTPHSCLAGPELPIQRYVLLILGIVSVVELMVSFGLALLPPGLLGQRATILINAVTLSAVSFPIVWIYLIRPLRRSMAADRRAILEYQQRILRQSAESEFETRLNAALEMVEHESDVLAIVELALGSSLPEHGCQLLLADNSRAHLRPVIQRDGADGSTCVCSVDQPMSCVAVRRGRALDFASSAAIDACPRLRDSSQDETAALCVPVTVGGRAIGVIHSRRAPASQLPEGCQHRLETVAAQAGSRIGMVRVLARTQLQARTDPLTGLLNRRSLEGSARELCLSCVPFAVVACDLDHFKRLNDTHGHDAGDRALRLFATTLRDCVRPEDLVARMGGEEFLFILPGCSVVDGAAVAGRVRKALAATLAHGAVPPFSASFGVADTTHGSELAAILPAADRALYEAKRTGRDRVVVASLDWEPAEPTDAADESLQPTSGQADPADPTPVGPPTPEDNEPNA